MNAREQDFGDNKEVTNFQNITIKQILN